MPAPIVFDELYSLRVLLIDFFNHLLIALVLHTVPMWRWLTVRLPVMLIKARSSLLTICMIQHLSFRLSLGAQLRLVWDWVIYFVMMLQYFQTFLHH